MAPLFSHLARDLYPSVLMKSRAPNVFRWTERMNLPDLFDGEFAETEASYPPDDAIAETLESLLAKCFKDWGPELLAIAGGIQCVGSGKSVAETRRSGSRARRTTAPPHGRRDHLHAWGSKHPERRDYPIALAFRQGIEAGTRIVRCR